MRKLGAAFVSAVALCGGTAERAYADQFVVTAPSGVSWAVDGDMFWLTGEGFNIRSDVFFFFAIPAVAGGGCLGTNIAGSPLFCTTGDLIDMSVHTPGEVGLGQGTATIDGATYTGVSFFGDLTFTATPSLFPASSDLVVFFHQPFVFNGTVRGVVDGQEVFDVDLTGSGTTARAFFRYPSGAYNYQMESLTSYNFDAAPAPTPEPASLVLLGSGLAGVVARARRRRG